ncbi:MAG: tetratricopeptide repeat protein [Cellvibrionaceae bacterium]
MKPFINQPGSRRQPRQVLLLGLVVLISACSSLSTGPERLVLVDQLLALEEFGEARQLLVETDSNDPEYEALRLRHDALEPLIVQFEENTVWRLRQLQEADEWSAAEALLDESLAKLPQSDALRVAETSFYSDRAARLAEIDRQITLLRGEHLAAKTALVQQVAQVHPRSLTARWQAFRHGREAESLARELADCGAEALEESQFELAESCLTMAASLTEDQSIADRLAILQDRRDQEEAQALARLDAERKAQQMSQRAQKAKHVNELKARYHQLLDAGWWQTAQDVLADLRAEVPRDSEVLAWSSELQIMIGQRVDVAIEQGQALYSGGQLQEALAVWREAAALDPDNPVLQAHIARVERFIAKLERLDPDEG